MTFTIDIDNNIAAYAGQPANAEHLQSFASHQELAKLAEDWPGTRLVEIWNSFAGVAPFNDLRPVKRFTSRKAAVERIWAAVQRLSPNAAPQAESVAPPKGMAKKSSAKTRRRARTLKGSKEERVNKKAEIVGLMCRAKGVTLTEIMELTGWLPHTVRGFVSLLGSKGGEKIESLRNAAGHRTYRMAK